jgi:hypothetical protein
MFLKFENLTRQEDDASRIATLKRKGWVEFAPEVVPQEPATEAPAWAFRAALRLDNLLGPVNTAIEAMPEARKVVAQEKLASGEVVSRKDSLMRYINENVPGVNKAKLDALFATANEIAAGKVGS